MLQQDTNHGHTLEILKQHKFVQAKSFFTRKNEQDNLRVHAWEESKEYSLDYASSLGSSQIDKETLTEYHYVYSKEL
mgnify:CR=1 FL=1